MVLLDRFAPLASGSGDMQVSDISQDGDYLKPIVMNRCSVVTPSAQFWVREADAPPKGPCSKGRFMLGNEKMLLQGMPWWAYHCDLTEKQLGDLAGNAFNVVDMMAVLGAPLLEFPYELL